MTILLAAVAVDYRKISRATVCYFSIGEQFDTSKGCNCIEDPHTLLFPIRFITPFVLKICERVCRRWEHSGPRFLLSSDGSVYVAWNLNAADINPMLTLFADVTGA